MHSIYMTTSTVSYNKYGPQIGNRKSRRDKSKRDDRYRDIYSNRNKTYTRKRGGERRRKNKRTDYSRKNR